MSAIVIYLLYVAISLGLVAVVGRALARSGRAVLAEASGRPDAVGQAVSRLLVVAFYLLSAGFVALTMPGWAHIGDAGRAFQLLSVKLGELLLVLGVLHLASTAVLARIRRGGGWAGRTGWANVAPGGVGPGGVDPGGVDPGGVDPGGVDPGSTEPDTTAGPSLASTASAGTRSVRTAAATADAPALWGPRPRHVH